MEESQQTKHLIPTKKKTKQKIIYKNQKRKVRNRLIYLVGFHIFFIFVFIGIMCVEYLVDWSWDSSQYYSMASDILYIAYFVETLVSIKFKNRKMLLISIFTLSLAIGTKTTCLLILSRQGSDVRSLVIVHLLLFVVNFFIPVSLLFLWNKLKSDKWRQTFDLHTKLQNHLKKEENNTKQSEQQISV